MFSARGEKRQAASSHLLGKVVSAIAFVAAFAASRVGCEKLQEARRAQAIQAAKEKVDQGKLFSEKELSDLAANPRTYWTKAKDRSVQLRAFEKSALMELGKDIPDIKPVRTTEESLPFAEHARVEFEATISERDMKLPILGHQSAFLAESGVLYVVAMADQAS